MIGGLLLIVLMYLVSLPLLGRLKARHKWMNLKLMKRLFWYHFLFAGVYYVTVMSSPSDSVEYYLQPQIAYATWFDSYDTGTFFMHFVAYPFINYLGFTYEMMMFLFAWLGYWGFVHFYLFFKENLKFNHYWKGYDLVTLILFLPNMHYWTASLGKGSIIFWGIALTIYGMSRLNTRKFALIFGMLIVYHIRPHIFLVMATGMIIAIFTGRQKVPLYQKLIVFVGGVVAIFFLYDKIIAFSGLQGENLMESFDEISSKRAGDLSKSGSGIDISSYPYPLKLLTFWYRPLFFDSPSLPGLMVSLENLFYIFLTFKIFDRKIFGFLSKGAAPVKASFIIFLGTSLAMCSTLSNLGLIIRQKTMIMYFFMFVILAFLDYKKGLKVERRRKMMEAANLQAATITA